MTRLGFTVIVLFVLVSLASVAVGQQLIDNGDGTVTDTHTGLMWLKNANMAGRNDMTWSEAMQWATNLDFAGYTDWRLPSALNPDGSGPCDTVANCSGSEMGHLYYVTLGNTYPWSGGGGLQTTGPFTNVSPYDYWNSTEEVPQPGFCVNVGAAWVFNFKDGFQMAPCKNSRGPAWVVRNVSGGPNPVPLDVWIRDCKDDRGQQPSTPFPCDIVYKSPDIFIDNNDDMIIDQPVIGAVNYLKAIVCNKSQAWAINVLVKFYYVSSGAGQPYPEGLIPIGSTIVSVGPNSSVVASVPWRIPPEPSGGDSHWCIFVQLDHPDDRCPVTMPSPEQSNNIAQANLWSIAQRAGESVNLSFSLGVGGVLGFGLQPWPRDFVVKVENTLPTDWTWKIDGVKVGEPFEMKQGEKRKVYLKVDVPKNTKPRSSGSFSVKQIDVKTGKVVGGLRYIFYEDHYPPKRVEDVRVRTVRGLPVISWAAVVSEEGTQAPEHMAYYEIFRNGKPIAKVVRTEDPKRKGFQWTDTSLLSSPATYTVKAVDEAKNVSKESKKAKFVSEK